MFCARYSHIARLYIHVLPLYIYSLKMLMDVRNVVLKLNFVQD